MAERGRLARKDFRIPGGLKDEASVPMDAKI